MMMLKLNQQATRSEQDPTHQAANRKKANQDNTTRLNNANKQVLALWRDVDSKKTVRKQVVNETLDFYVYDLTPNDLERLSLEIESIINSEMETEQLESPFNWYYSQYVEQATRGGVIQENSWIEVLLAGLVFATIANAVLLSSVSYQTFLISVIEDNYRLLKNLSATTSRQVFDVINRGMAAGLGKAAIQRQITNRFQVAKSSSRRIVNTEINKAYNNARMNTVEIYRQFGAPLGVQHLSALLTTTRKNHAARHGKGYTPEQQRQWWDTSTNRINCHCSTRAIVLNKDGTIEDKDAQDKVIKRGKDWFKSN